MTAGHIRFAPDILRRLGEELNPSPDQGILELVKNAYDADATSCRVELIDIDRPRGSIRVVDDGDGMDLEGIQRGWLVLGQSDKPLSERTRLGRTRVGSKGLGRLAALRMGSTAKLLTRPREDPSSEYRVTINWRDYEHVEVVDDVILTITRGSSEPDSSSGSEIVIKGITRKIGRAEVKRLARALVLLADPFGQDPKGFRPFLTAPEFSDLEALVQNRFFADADYHLIASIDEKGNPQASVVDFRGETLFTADHNELLANREGRPYESPPSTFDLWAFILTRATFSSRSATLGAVRSWLQVFGGVHVYYNGLRVSPYGNLGDDWLEMNLSRVRSPEERPGTNTSIGRVAISDPSELLKQKTDRSGFIEAEPFLELRSFAQDAMEWMAKRRLEVAERRRRRARAAAPKRTQRSKVKLEKVIESSPEPPRSELKKALRAYDKFRDREVGRLQKEVQLYRTLSTVGITAATFAHESSGAPIKVIIQSTRAIERRLKKILGEKYDTSFRKPIEGILRASDGLDVLSRTTLRLLDHEKRRLTRVDIHAVIRGLLDTFAPFFRERDVTVDLDLFPGSPYLHSTEASIESVITNLINNSMAAFERAGVRKRRILIRTEVADDFVTLRVLDNGPGIEGISKKDIWLPGQTTKRNGTGLGLTIVRDAVSDLGGSVDAIEHGELGGAEIILEVPILGA